MSASVSVPVSVSGSILILISVVVCSLDATGGAATSRSRAPHHEWHGSATVKHVWSLGTQTTTETKTRASSRELTILKKYVTS